jgi:DNA-binding CsgD family transcriptional regulator
MLGRSCAYQMEYKRAIELYEIGLNDVDRMRLDFAASHFHLGLANAHIGLANYGIAEQSLRRAREFASDAHTLGNWHLVTARLGLAQHRYALARRVLGQAGRARDAATRAEVCAYAALAEACLGNRSAALALASETTTISGTVEPAVVSTIARLLVLREERDGILDELVQLVDARGHADFVVHACRTFPSLGTALADARATSPTVDAAVAFASATSSSLLETLTRREREILVLMAEGLRNREIASRLYITEVTVKTHVRHILEKTGTRSRTEAAVLVAHERASG